MNKQKKMSESPVSMNVQELAEKFVYEHDDSVFFKCMGLMECGIKNYIIEFLKSKSISRISSFVDEIYDMTIDSVYDNARDYYSKEKGKFSTWVYFVTRRNCINAIRPYVENGFYVVNPDFGDIESNNFDDESEKYRYKVQISNDTLYTYTIDGIEKTSCYSELMDDVISCVHSCIYFLDDNTDVKKRDKDILRRLYIEGKTMQVVSEELGVKICVVKNAVTFRRGDLLLIFKDKYSDLYSLIESEKIFKTKVAA